MATFTYDAVNSAGRTIRGRVEAENEQLVISKLHEQQLHVVNVASAKAGGFSFTAKTQKVRLQSLVVFSRQFATMINAGIAIIKCLDILEGQTKDEALKVVISQVRKDVKGGLSLTDAVAKHPNIFSKLYINMIRAAEIGGILDVILDRLAGFLEKELEIKQKVKSAMMYPAIVLVFAFLIVVALFIFVLPRFKDIFASMNVDMPPTTAALFAMSDFMIHFWYIFIAGGVAGFVAFRQYGKTPRGRHQIDTLKLKAPIMGDLVLKFS